LDKFQRKNIKRVPILQPNGVVEALLYLEGVMSYLLGVQEPDRPNKTLGDLLKERPDLKQNAAYVSEGATLAEAKSAMEKIDNCKLIFVTKSGDAKEPVLGVLTNTDIAKYSKA
jgi:hypothetical protein